MDGHPVKLCALLPGWLATCFRKDACGTQLETTPVSHHHHPNPSNPTPHNPPAPQFVNFAFVPRHLRIPYVAAVSFGWTVILSVMQGKFDAAIQQRKIVAGAGAPATPAAPAPPSLLPPAAAAAVQQQEAAASATASSGAPAVQQERASAASGASTQAVRGMLQSPIVAAAVAEVPAHQGSAVEEA